MKNGAATVASYSYDAVGNRTRVDYGNGTYTTFGYESGDPRYRLETITHKLETTALATFGYTRDDVGNPLSFTSLEGAWAYTYDAMNRLASATPPAVPLPAQAGGAYSYDWVGNLKAAAPSNPWSYNAADQLTLWPGMHSYEYDDNGALTAVRTADGSATQQTFTYHPNGLMNTATFNNQTQTLTNLWDADEHRVHFSVGEDDYTAVFDVTAGIPAVIKDITPSGTIYYVREPGGEVLCRAVGENKWFYHFDELGSTRLITDDSGAVTDRYTYDAYGTAIAHDRNTGAIDQPYQFVGQLGYYTHYQAPEFGWLQLGVRFYDPETGRFERPDPLDEIANGYYYAESGPTVLVDPTGGSGEGKSRNFDQRCRFLKGKIVQYQREVTARGRELIADRYRFGIRCQELTPTAYQDLMRHIQLYEDARNRRDRALDEWKQKCKGPPPVKKVKDPVPVLAPAPEPDASPMWSRVPWRPILGTCIVAGAGVYIYCTWGGLPPKKWTP